MAGASLSMKTMMEYTRPLEQHCAIIHSLHNLELCGTRNEHTQTSNEHRLPLPLMVDRMEDKKDDAAAAYCMRSNRSE